MSLLVAVLTAFVNIPVDACFEYLKAPTADNVKLKQQENIAKRIGRRVSSVARRVSIAAVDLASHAAMELKRQRQSKLGFEFRELEDSVVQAHDFALSSLPMLSSSCGTIMAARKAQRATIIDITKRSVAGVPEDMSGMARRIRTISQNQTNSLLPGDFESVRVKQDSFCDLHDDIVFQRKVLHPSEVGMFDYHWGLQEDTHSFVVMDNQKKSLVQRLCGMCSTYQCRTAETVIREEMKVVEQISQGKIEKLTFATDADIGLEIMHAFILDLLGRDTAAAKIFSAKSGSDYQFTSVVSRTMKSLIWSFVVLLNIFFVYFCILRGFERGVDWQRSYLVGCIVQLCVELVVFETMECLWTNFFVPNLIAEDVKLANEKLLSNITSICANAPTTCAPAAATRKGAPDIIFMDKGDSDDDDDDDDEEKNNDVEDVHFLNFTPYLFVSSKIAKAYPDMLESLVVLSYTAYLPEELSKKWTNNTKVKVAVPESNYVGRLFSRSMGFGVSFSIMGILKSFGSSPIVMQRVLLHLVQPLFLAGIVFGGLYMYKNPLYFFALGFVFIMAVMYDLQHLRNAASTVQPVLMHKRDSSSWGAPEVDVLAINRLNKETRREARRTRRLNDKQLRKRRLRSFSGDQNRTRTRTDSGHIVDGGAQKSGFLNRIRSISGQFSTPTSDDRRNTLQKRWGSGKGWGAGRQMEEQYSPESPTPTPSFFQRLRTASYNQTKINYESSVDSSDLYRYHTDDEDGSQSSYVLSSDSSNSISIDMMDEDVQIEGGVRPIGGGGGNVDVCSDDDFSSLSSFDSLFSSESKDDDPTMQTLNAVETGALEEGKKSDEEVKVSEEDEKIDEEEEKIDGEVDSIMGKSD